MYVILAAFPHEIDCYMTTMAINNGKSFLKGIFRGSLRNDDDLEPF